MASAATKYAITDDNSVLLADIVNLKSSFAVVDTLVSSETLAEKKNEFTKKIDQEIRGLIDELLHIRRSSILEVRRKLENVEENVEIAQAKTKLFASELEEIEFELELDGIASETKKKQLNHDDVAGTRIAEISQNWTETLLSLNLESLSSVSLHRDGTILEDLKNTLREKCSNLYSVDFGPFSTDGDVWNDMSDLNGNLEIVQQGISSSQNSSQGEQNSQNLIPPEDMPAEASGCDINANPVEAAKEPNIITCQSPISNWESLDSLEDALAQLDLESELQNGCQNSPKKTTIFATHRLTLGVMDVENPMPLCFSKPIGCAQNPYDHCWFVCDTGHDAVKVFSPEGQPLGCLQQQLPLTQPSAIVVLPGAQQFAVKEQHSVFIVDKKTGQPISQLRTARGHYYGLVWDTYRNTLGTLENARRGDTAAFVQFDPRAPPEAACVGRQAYSTLAQLNAQQAAASMPRFMHCRDGRLAISDLGINRVTVVNASTLAPWLSFGKAARAEPDFSFASVATEAFSFASGVAIDQRARFFVGDAKANRVQLFNSCGEFESTLVLPPPGAPFVGDLHLTDDNQLMLTSRSRHVAIAYDLILPCE